MKLLTEANDAKLFTDIVDGIILPLEDYAVESHVFFSLEKVKEIVSNCTCEVFIKINKNLLNSDIEPLKEILLELDKIEIDGIFFYDLAILQLKKELGLKVDLVWNQTHMVNNYKTCNYYYSKGVKYALLGKEITLDEIREIITRGDITSMVEVVSKPSVAFSKRKLVTNYFKDLGREGNNSLKVTEKVTNTNYDVVEDKNGTNFYLGTVTNGTGIIKDLFEVGCKYIIFREYGLEDIFLQLIIDTKEYILNKCVDTSYVQKYKILGDSTNFFFKKTIYKVKKNG